MKRSLLLKGALGLALFATVSCAFAWGSVGHRAVGGIADRLLDEKARAAVADLLSEDLDKHGDPSGRTSLAEVSTWADEIRRTEADRPLRHYDDIPACGPIPPTPTWCPASGECASRQIEVQLAILRDASRTKRERNEALKWIVHLVGDIHQPLHAASNIYSNGMRDEEGHATDRGGNDIQVALEGVKTRGKRELHGVWDIDLVNLALGLPVSERAGPSGPMLERLAAEARRVPRDLLAGTPLDWALQSNALARKVAYNFPAFVCKQPIAGIVVLDRSYIDTATKVISTQLELAGARLAALLNATLGESRQ